MSSKNKAKQGSGYKRYYFKYFLYSTIVIYIFLYLLGTRINISTKHNELLSSLIIGNFACTITAVSIFAVFDYKNNEAVLLTKYSKIWFIDAILLALCNLIYSLVFSINCKTTLFFIVVISCYHTYMIFHYYLRERFNKNNEENGNIIVEAENGETTKERDEPGNNFKEIAKGFGFTLADAIMILLPAILFLIFDWKFQSDTIIFYVIFATYIIGCIAIKELYLENRNIRNK